MFLLLFFLRNITPFLNQVRGFVYGLVSLPTLQAGSNMYFFPHLSMNMYHKIVIYLLWRFNALQAFIKEWRKEKYLKWISVSFETLWKENWTKIHPKNYNSWF
jgi:hypothetical protein